MPQYPAPITRTLSGRWFSIGSSFSSNGDAECIASMSIEIQPSNSCVFRYRMCTLVVPTKKSCPKQEQTRQNRRKCDPIEFPRIITFRHFACLDSRSLAFSELSHYASSVNCSRRGVARKGQTTCGPSQWLYCRLIASGGFLPSSF
jgi:hypothetical protein